MTTTKTKTKSAAGAASSDRVFNFSAGPAVLPEEVLRQAQQDLWNLAGTGIGILEHSHRGPAFIKVLEEAVADCRAVASIPDDYAVLFLQGGATLQFSMVPMNFLAAGQVADYLDTGVWTAKAIAEAKLLGKVNVAFDGSATKYDHVPADREVKLTSGAAYTWYCSNNTVFGTEYPGFPASKAPLVCDASSDIFSRAIDVAKHALILAGAQKNLGPAGATLVIIRKDFMGRGKAGLPSMLDYRKHAEADSCLNTCPTFAIYVMGLVFKWIREQGGLEVLARRNQKKAAALYQAIDSSGGFYRGVARPDSRSLMNVTFKTPSEGLDKAFADEARRQGMDGLKGHRSAGGLRASIYNAFPPAGCEALASFMKDFAKRNG